LTRANIINGGLGSRRLATARLALRWIEPDDARALAQYGGDALIRQKTETIPEPYDEATARTWIAQSQSMRLKGSAFRFTVTDRVSGDFIGVCALAMIEGEEGVAELGYWLGRPFWDQGYGREAVTALIAFGRDVLRLKTIQAIVYAENTASVAVLGRLNFTESEYELIDVPERGGKRLVRRFTLLLDRGRADDGQSDVGASPKTPPSKARVA